MAFHFCNQRMKAWHWWALGIGVVVLGTQGNRYRVMSDLSKVKLGEFFTLDEFVKTSTGIDNIPPADVVERLRKLVVNVLDPLRKAVGKPIRITSGYRSPSVNAAVIGSSKTSQHMKGEASDLQIDGMTNQQIIDKIRQLRLPYDQLIDEQRGSSLWVHVSYNTSGSPRYQWLTRRDPSTTRPNEYETIKVGLA